MVFVEGQAPGGVQVGLMIPAGTLPARIGQRLAVSVETPNAASTPSMRERMVRTEALRSAATAAPASTAAASSTPSDMTDAVLAAVFGTSPAAELEYSVPFSDHRIAGSTPMP